MATNKSVFETLNEINVNDKTEEKNGLTYLSWAWAWASLERDSFCSSSNSVAIASEEHRRALSCWVGRVVWHLA